MAAFDEANELPASPTPISLSGLSTAVLGNDVTCRRAFFSSVSPSALPHVLHTVCVHTEGAHSRCSENASHVGD